MLTLLLNPLRSDALRTSLEPLLTATSAANLVLDYKPHPGPSGPSHTSSSAFSANPSLPRGDSTRTESPHRHNRERSNNTDGESRRGGGGERASSRNGGGFSSYTARGAGESRDRTADAFGAGVGAIGSGAGAGFGRSSRRTDIEGKGEGETRAPISSWGRV